MLFSLVSVLAFDIVPRPKPNHRSRRYGIPNKVGLPNPQLGSMLVVCSLLRGDTESGARREARPVSSALSQRQQHRQCALASPSPGTAGVNLLACPDRPFLRSPRSPPRPQPVANRRRPPTSTATSSVWALCCSARSRWVDGMVDRMSSMRERCCDVACACRRNAFVEVPCLLQTEYVGSPFWFPV